MSSQKHIDSKNAFLRFLVENRDSSNRYTNRNIQKDLGLNAIDLTQYLQELKSDGYIEVYLGGTFLVYQKAINRIKSEDEERKKRPIITLKSGLKHLWKAMSSLLKWVLGIAAAVIAAYIVWKLGLQQ